MEELIKKYEETRAKLKALGYAQYVISWDSETIAPSGCFDERSKQLGVLSEESYKLETDPEFIKVVDELFAKQKKLKPVFRHEIIEAKKSLDKIRKIPLNEFVEFQMLLAKSNQIWAKAKNKNDFKSFQPFLEKIVDFERKYIKYLETDELKGYDVLLDEYEHGFTQKEYDEFFDLLKKELVPFIQKVTSTKLEYNDDYKQYKFKKEKQKKFNEYILKVFNFDMEHGVLNESEHPFTSGFGTTDVRITTHYHEDNVISNIFSTIHELGHATYEQQVDPALDDTYVGGGASTAMHESQSRFYENIIGRSRVFWETHFPKLKKLFKKEFANTSLDDFYKSVNESTKSLIRIEADELTYPIHIMIRYDIEKALLAGEIEVKDLPEVWNKMVKEYLAIDVPTDREGVLQDTHWAGGSFGYFPTYALGSAYSAQIYHKMKEEIDVEAISSKRNLKGINNWLKKKIHKYGSSKYPKEILKDATGEDFNPKYYVDYLIDKYSKIYNL